MKNKTKTRLYTPTVDIVIPVYNRFDILQRCLDAIPAAMGRIPYSVSLIDNNSNPNDAKGFYAQFKNTNAQDMIIRTKRNKENFGFPAACNQGARMGTATLIFFLNSDVILDPGSVEKMVSTVFDNTKVGVVGMKLVFPDDVVDMGLNPNIRPANKIQHVGLFTNVRAEFVHVFSGWSEDNPRPNAIREAHAVTGAALLVRRQLFNQAGGFWEGYGLGTWEDVDLCMAVRKMGYNVLVNTKARGVHYTGATAEKYNIQYPMNQNHQMFLGRWQSNLVYSEYNAW